MVGSETAATATIAAVATLAAGGAAPGPTALHALRCASSNVYQMFCQALPSNEEVPGIAIATAIATAIAIGP